MSDKITKRPWVIYDDGKAGWIHRYFNTPKEAYDFYSTLEVASSWGKE